MGHKISREQIDPRVKDEIMSLVGDISELETEVNSDIISAVNSLIVDRVDNIESMGKIANAVGNPLDSNDSVNGAVNKLNELLSTFKINMMNNGVTIESGDKFKQLIDKISTLSDEDVIKNTRVIHGTTIGKQVKLDNGYTDIIVEVHGIPFEPICGYIKHDGIDNGYFISYEGLKICSTDSSNNITIYEDGFRMGTATTESGRTYTYWVIGIGEDNTLRDSLANILGDKGIEVSPEDDMATLIGKVDSIKGGLDIKAVTELPSVGVEGSIYTVTDNPVENIVVSNDINDYTNDSNTIFIQLANASNSKAELVEIVSGYTTVKYYFINTLQGGIGLETYIYSNNEWRKLTIGEPIFLINGMFVDRNFFGGKAGSSSYWSLVEGTGIRLSCSTSTSVDLMFNSYGMTLNNLIDFTPFNKLVVEAYGTYSTTFYIGGTTTAKSWAEDGDTASYFKKKVTQSIGTEKQTFTIDVSSWTGEMYLGFQIYCSVGSYLKGEKYYITDVRFEY